MFFECTFIVIRSARAGEILKNILTYLGLLTNKQRGVENSRRGEIMLLVFNARNLLLNCIIFNFLSIYMNE